MIYVDDRHTWKFQTASQVTAPNDITEKKPFNGLVAMDFTQPMRADDSIESITSAAFADVAASTEPTISSSAISSDKKSVQLTLATSSATLNTYTASVKVVTVAGDTIVRKGRLVLS